MSLAIVIVKLCGMIYKVALTRVYGLFGEELASFGMGLFSNAYEIYIPLFTIATAGFPIAVSRLVSECNAQKRYKDIKMAHKVSIPFFVIMGIICSVLMFGGSFFYIKIINSPYALPSMLCLTPTIFFGCLVSIYRGYFEGMRNMTPTSVSEILEGVGKLAIGLTLSYIIMKLGLSGYESTGTIFGLTFPDEKTAIYTLVGYSVTGAVLGITLSTVVSFLYLFFKYRKTKGGITEQQLIDSVDSRTKNETFKILLKTAIPIGLGALVMNVSSILDGAIIQRVLSDMSANQGSALANQYPMFADAVKDETIHTKLWGCYASALTVMQIVTAITQAFGTTAMPMVTNAYTKGDKVQLKTGMDKVMKLTCIVTLPLGIGLSVMAEPIMQITYGGSVAVVGAECLKIMGYAVLFMAASTPICSMLQGVGNVNAPVILYSIAMVIKVIMNFSLVTNVDINIKGAATGTLVGYLFVCVVAMYLLIKKTKVRVDFPNTVVKPLVGGIACGLTAYFIYYFIKDLMNIYVSTFISIGAGAIVYVILVLLLGTFNDNDLDFLKKNEKIRKILAKFRIMG